MVLVYPMAIWMQYVSVILDILEKIVKYPAMGFVKGHFLLDAIQVSQMLSCMDVIHLEDVPTKRKVKEDSAPTFAFLRKLVEEAFVNVQVTMNVKLLDLVINLTNALNQINYQMVLLAILSLGAHAKMECA